MLTMDMPAKKIQLHELPDLKAKFSDPDTTASGEPRASVSPRQLETLWINTGSMCNLTCKNCYIESSPTNDRLSYISVDEVQVLLDEIKSEKFPTKEIAFTGGEPFLNEDMIPIMTLCLTRGFSILVLSNAMQTMHRQAAALANLHAQYGDMIRIRVSLDHYSEQLHAKERGKRSWAPAIKGLKWLSSEGFCFSVAGRTYWNEDDKSLRAGYAALFDQENIHLNAASPEHLMLFPEMDASQDVPEITTSCWKILDKNPADIMCSSSRMVVKRKGDARPSIMACTLLPYDQRFNLGSTLKESWRSVKLNHPHCTKFCILGGGSCSG